MGWRDGTCAHPGIPAALFSAGLYSSSSSTFETGADAKTLRRSTGPDPFVVSADLSFVASLLAANSVTCADAESRCRLGACHRKKGPRDPAATSWRSGESPFRQLWRTHRRHRHLQLQFRFRLRRSPAQRARTPHQGRAHPSGLPLLARFLVSRLPELCQSNGSSVFICSFVKSHCFLSLRRAATFLHALRHLQDRSSFR